MNISCGILSLNYYLLFADPFTSPWKRRNEIMIDVEPKTQVPL